MSEGPKSPAVAATVVRELDALRGPLAVFETLRTGPEGYGWLLESALPSAGLGRFSFAGADPYLVLRAFVRGAGSARVELVCRRAAWPGLSPGRSVLDADPLAVARALLPALPAGAAGGIPFAGGAVGWLGYELAALFEPIAFHGSDDLGLPDLALLFVDRLAVFDHRRGTLAAVGLGMGDDVPAAQRRAGEAADALAWQLARAPAHRAPRSDRTGAAWEDSLDRGRYAKAVDAVLEEIAAGNVYQANLTHRLTRKWDGDAWDLYRRVRRANPAPFASFLELPEASVVGSSPERFLRVAPDGRAESRPIKGTRPRGRHPAEDAALRAELAGSGKDRAENVMIVDLVRNDLGRVCETGSVHVAELMAIEPYASVFQMVSTVRGRLRPDRDVFDLVRASFPPGSMTGAPKIAAMRLCDRLEPVRRGIYSGAIGYFDARGGADLSVVIRTAIASGGRVCVHSGGALVADSRPEAEWREAGDKVAPLLEALSG